MKGNISNILKQAQQMQTKMQEAQEQLANTVVEGKAGGNLVIIKMNGRHDVLKVQIDDNVRDEPKEVEEDLIAAAFNDAVRKVEKVSRDKLNAITAGIDLPTGFGSLTGGDNKV